MGFTAPPATPPASPFMSFTAKAHASRGYSFSRTWIEQLLLIGDRPTTRTLRVRVGAVTDRLHAVLAASTPPIVINDKELAAAVEVALADCGLAVGMRDRHLACNLHSSLLTQRDLHFAFLSGAPDQ